MTSNHIVNVVLSLPKQHVAPVIHTIVTSLNDTIHDFDGWPQACIDFATAIASIESFELLDNKKRINIAGKVSDRRYGVICDCCQARQTKRPDQLELALKPDTDQ